MSDVRWPGFAGMVSFHRTGFGAPMGKIGHFAGLIDFGAEDALVLCTDGVGSKVEIVGDTAAVSAPDVANLKPESMVDLSLIQEIKASGFLDRLALTS